MTNLVLPAMLLVGMAHPSLAITLTGGSMSGSVADYNAAQVRDNHGLLTVATGMVTYTANTAIPVGSYFNVTLPKSFEFTTEPMLTSTTATLSFVKYVGSANTAEFIVTGSQVSVKDTIVLGGYRVKGASALATVSPAGAGYPVSMQALGIDPQPLPYNEFASDGGIAARFNGNSLTIDLSSPSNGTEFYVTPTAQPAYLSRTVQLGNLTIAAAKTDIGGVTVLAPDASPNALASTDTATFELPGYLFGGFSVYASKNASCATSTWPGKVTPTLLSFPNLPINKEVYLCAKGSGNQLVKLIGYPNSETTLGFGTGFVINSHPDDDFVSSGNVSSGGGVCYALEPPTNSTCVPEFYNFFTTTVAKN